MSFPKTFEALEEATRYEGYANNGEILVEIDGFTSTKDLVEEMLYAGERLAAWRVQEYDYDGDEDEDLDKLDADPSASPNFDFVDADNIIERANAKYQEYVRRVLNEQQRTSDSDGSDTIIASDNGTNSSNINQKSEEKS